MRQNKNTKDGMYIQIFLYAQWQVLGEFHYDCSYHYGSAQWQIFHYSMASWWGRLHPPNGGFCPTPYCHSVTFSIADPAAKASASGPLNTILPIEVVMVSRYTDLVELSHTILLALMLEIPGVILPIAAMSKEIPPPHCAGSSILAWVMMPVKPWYGVEGCTTTNALVDGNIGIVGVPGEQIGGWAGAT